MALIQMIQNGSLGVLGPILLILLGFWMARGDRSPWYIKALLAVALAMLLLTLGYI